MAYLSQDIAGQTAGGLVEQEYPGPQEPGQTDPLPHASGKLRGHLGLDSRRPTSFRSLSTSWLIFSFE